jgi:hypothetical protein
MKNQDTVRKEVCRLIADQPLAVLSTHQAGQPYASLVAIAGTSNLADIYFLTARDTSKFMNILEDSRVAMLVDNRTNQAADFQAAAALTAIGRAGELEGEAKDMALALFLARHPTLAEFARAPATVLVRIAVSRYILVTTFQEVAVLDMQSV